MNTEKIATTILGRIQDLKLFLANGSWANPNDPEYSNGYDAAIEAEIEFLEGLIKDIDNLITTANQNASTNSGHWAFERSSGYAVWRCQKCGTWVYDKSDFKCRC